MKKSSPPHNQQESARTPIPHPRHPLCLQLRHGDLQPAKPTLQQVKETPKIFFVAQGPHIPARLLTQLKATLATHENPVRLPSGSSRGDAFRLGNVANTPRAQKRVRDLLSAEPIDYAFVPADRTIDRVRLVMYDMDGTTITINSNEEFRRLVPDIAKKEAQFRDYRLAHNLPLNDEECKRIRTQWYRGLTEEQIASRVRENVLPKLSPGAQAVADAFRPYATQVLASMGFTHVTKEVVALLDLDAHIANKLGREEVDGERRLTGEILGEVINPSHKARWMRELQRGLNRGDLVLAVGNAENDIAMFRTARHFGGFAVAYHAVPPDAPPTHSGHATEAAADHVLRYTNFDGIKNLLAPV